MVTITGKLTRAANADPAMYACALRRSPVEMRRHAGVAPAVRRPEIPGRPMKRLRRHLSPLATDTISPLNLPPVRMGLLTKLNLLTVGLIFLTAVATTGYYLWQQWRHEEFELRAHGATVIRMLVELSEYGLYTTDSAYLETVLDALDTESDIAYVSAVDARRKPIAERRFVDALRNVDLPALDGGTELPSLGTFHCHRTGDSRGHGTSS